MNTQEIAPVPLTDAPVDVIAGRTVTLSTGSNVSSVRVLQGPENGNVTANADGTIAVVMSDTDYTGPDSFIYQVQYDDGRIETSRAELNLTPGVQAKGWGMGDFMLLETDENDRTIVETGNNHRKIYVSGSDDALSLDDIAVLEGISKAQIIADKQFFKKHPEYGATPEMAVDGEAGAWLSKVSSAPPHSN